MATETVAVKSNNDTFRNVLLATLGGIALGVIGTDLTNFDWLNPSTTNPSQPNNNHVGDPNSTKWMAGDPNPNTPWNENYITVYQSVDDYNKNAHDTAPHDGIDDTTHKLIWLGSKDARGNDIAWDSKNYSIGIQVSPQMHLDWNNDKYDDITKEDLSSVSPDLIMTGAELFPYGKFSN